MSLMGKTQLLSPVLSVVAMSIALTACTNSGWYSDTVEHEKNKIKAAYKFRRSSGCVNGFRTKDMYKKQIAMCSNLRGENLSDQDLSRKDLRGSNLEGAWVNRTNFEGADLRGADLRNVEVRTAKSWRGAMISAETKLPANITVSDAANLGMRMHDYNYADQTLISELNRPKPNQQTVERLVEAEGADPRALNGSIDALTSAVLRGHTDVVRYFLSIGVDVDAREGGAWPLLATVANKDVTILRMLVDNGARLHERGAGVVREYAINRGVENRAARLKALFELGAPKEIPACSEDRTCLVEAMRANNLESVQLLLSNGVSVNGFGATTVLEQYMVATGGKDSPFIDVLMNSRPRLSATAMCTTLLENVRSGTLARKLLAAGAPVKPAQENCTDHAFYSLVRNLQNEERRSGPMNGTELRSLFAAFFESKALPTSDAQGNPTVMRFLSSFNYFQALVDAGLDWRVRDRGGRSIVDLIIATPGNSGEWAERSKIFNWLFTQKNLSLDEVDGSGDTLATRMIRAWYTDSSRRSYAVELMRNRSFGANPIVGSTGRTLIHQLIIDSRGELPREMIQFLVSKGADLNAPSKDGTVALAACPTRQCILELLGAGANASYKGPGGENLLMMRLREGREIDSQMLNEFLAKGLDLKDQDAKGRNLMDYAIIYDTTGRTADLLAQSFPSHPFNQLKYLKCENDNAVYSIQLVHSRLMKRQFRGESVRWAPKNDLKRVTMLDEPLAFTWRSGDNGLVLSLTSKQVPVMRIESEDLRQFSATAADNSQMQCAMVDREPLAAKEFQDLFLDCRDSGLQVDWLKLHKNGMSAGVIRDGRGRQAMTAFREQSREKFPIFGQYNGYTVQDNNGGRYFVYAEEAALKAGASMVNVLIADRSISKVGDAHAQGTCRLIPTSR